MEENGQKRQVGFKRPPKLSVMGKSTDGSQDGSSKPSGGWANVRGKLGISMRQPTHATSDFMKIAESMFR